MPFADWLRKRLPRRADPDLARASGGPQCHAAAPLVPDVPWIVDHVRIDQKWNTRVEITGWALPDPVLGPASPGRFLFNGGLLLEVSYPVQREDALYRMWAGKNAAYSGFRCAVTARRETLFIDGMLEMSYVIPGLWPRVAAHHSYFVCDPDLEAPVPDETRRFRVVGNPNPAAFLYSGCTDFKRLAAAASVVGGAGFASHPRILDWGCGCGRLARYAVKLPGVTVTGCDIDVDNVGWCATNLKGLFIPTEIQPPLPFAAASFDLAYGVSVFTHMREPLQDSWLAELNRITAPRALLLMTIHGQTALDCAGLRPTERASLHDRMRREGIVVTGDNDQIDGFAAHEGEYVNAFHDLGYVRTRWGRTFDILDILPGYVYTHDLVIMRKRE